MTIKIFLGVIGSGKSFRSQQLVDQGYEKISVADPMRETLWKILGWKPQTDEEYQAFKRYNLLDVPQFHHITGRSVLQNIGETFKDLFGRDYWAKTWYKAVIRRYMYIPWEELNQNIVCDDVRFPEEVNEALRMKEDGNEVDFIFCDYNSDRYNPSNVHISERYAQAILALNKYKDGDAIDIKDLKIINKLFYE